MNREKDYFLWWLVRGQNHHTEVASPRPQTALGGSRGRRWDTSRRLAPGALDTAWVQVCAVGLEAIGHQDGGTKPTPGRDRGSWPLA